MVATALPSHRYTQEQLVEVTRGLLPQLNINDKVLRRFFRSTGVEQRSLALPIERYARLSGLKDRSEAWLSVALELGETVVRRVLDEAEMSPRDVGLFMSTTITGLAVPSLEARLMNRIDFAPTTKRVPLFGLGCLAGAAGLARASEYLRAFPTEAALLLSVELCSLTVQRDDPSVANLISTGLFGDGAAAVLLVGAEHPLAPQARPCIIDSRSMFFPGTESVMGWDMVDSGFKIVLSPEVPQLAREQVPKLIDDLLAKNGLSRDQVRAWIAHPGGPAVMEGLRAGLGLGPESLDATRQCLAQVGNLSSASVLFLLDEHCRRRRPESGSYGVLLAMGPAFCAEAVLLRW
ncbi:MAG: Chalcone synthase [Myxococcaceae bacterium]|nr:Chalcone synthase [Myxococcaceae bacterium]